MSRPLSLPLAGPERGELAPERSFELLYERHFEFVYRCLRRMGVAATHAEDAAQDTFIVMHRRLVDLRSDASERGFLFGIASNVAREYRRKQQRTQGLPLDADSPAQGETSPDERAAQAQAARALDRFLATLDDDQRAVFVLMELEELSAPEASEALGVKLNTVYSRLRLGRERFVRFFHAEKGREP